MSEVDLSALRLVVEKSVERFDKGEFGQGLDVYAPEFLALLSRLEQAEQDRVKLRNRLDAMRRQRDGYRNQLRKARTANTEGAGLGRQGHRRAPENEYSQ